MVMDLEKQLDTIYRWFQATFDSYGQYHIEKEAGKSSGAKPIHDWVFSKFFAVTMPKFGEHILLARQGFRETGKIYRQRVYLFHVNEKEGCVENKIFKLKDESLFEKAEQDPSVVTGLDPSSDAECMDGCSVFWEYLEGKNLFHGATKEGSCRFESNFFPGKTIIATSDIFVGPNHLWTLDRGVDTDGNKIYGFKSDEHHKFILCRTYDGIARFVNEDATTEVVLHNQGGEARVGDTGYVVKLAQVVEPDAGDHPSVLRLSVHKDGEDEPLGMAVSDPDSVVIGGVFAKNLYIHLRKRS